MGTLIGQAIQETLEECYGNDEVRKIFELRKKQRRLDEITRSCIDFSTQENLAS